MNGSIDIIIPIYNALDCLKECIDSLLQTTPTSTRIILIDDASSDKNVQSWIRQSTGTLPSHWVWFTNQSNQGFVATVNQGMKFSSRDCVILNTDTLLTEGWLQAISRCALSDDTIASITPFSNNAEICSIPNFCEINPIPERLDLLLAALKGSGSARYPTIPTGVGYCMYIRRHALDELGYFDQETFGLGYGEENDFCMRASKAGWRNVLCDDAYVIHHGNKSFSSRNIKPNQAAMERLLNKHPDYLNIVSQFIKDDPLKLRRQEIIDYYERLKAA